jgi:predicted ABC-class ATPase
MFVWDLVLGSAGGSTSLAASLAEEVENQINTVATNGV